MSTTTSIFSFDHGQKKMHNAIGVSEEFLNDLQDQVRDVLKDTLFDENKDVKDDISPSMLVEACLHQFSYSQLVVMASFFLQEKLDGFTEMMKDKMKSIVKKIAIDSDDIPDHIKEMLIRMAREGKTGGLIDGNNLPQELKDFLDSIVDKQEGDGDDD
jgi:hypothetical protein